MSAAIYVVDTNVLMRYLLKDDIHQFDSVEPYFINAEHQLYLPIQTLCETVWIMKKVIKLPNKHIAQVIEGLLSQPNIVFDKEVVDFALPFLKENGDFADGVITYHATLPSKTLLTFDKKLQHLCQKFDVKCTAL